jgi:photosystem II stability/assembly factor-like uncharacterized protein
VENAFMRWRLTSTLIVLVALAGHPARAGLNRWTPFGPVGGPVTGLAADPRTPGVIYASTESAGLYASRDGGDSWVWSALGMGGPAVQSVAVDLNTPSTLFAGGSGALYRSRDAGRHWEPLSLSASPSDYVRSFALGPGRRTALYAVSDCCFPRNKLSRSLDGGDSWVSILDTAGSITAVAPDPTDPRTLYVGFAIPYTGGSGGLLKSADGGASWSEVTPLGGNAGGTRLLAVVPARPPVVLVLAEFGFFRSTDGGASWDPAVYPDQWVPLSLVADPFVPGRVYSTDSSGGVARSDDAGQSWVTSARGLAGELIGPVAVDAGGTVYSATTLGVFRSRNRGRRWSQALERGRTSARTVMLEFRPGDPGEVFATLDDDRPGLWRSGDGGQSWERFAAALGPEAGYPVPDLAFDPADPAHIYAAEYDRVAESRDGGVTWRQVLVGRGRSLALLGRRTLLAAEGGVDRSDDGGATWTTTLPREEAGVLRHAGELVPDPARPEIVYLIGWDEGNFNLPQGVENRVYRSLDGGLTWRLFLRQVSVLALDGRHPGTLYYAQTGAIFKTNDDGGHWRRLPLPDPYMEPTSLVVDPFDSVILYAGTSSAGVLRSGDGGVTWAPLNRGLQRLGISEIARIVAHPADPGHLFVLPATAGAFEAVFPP